MTTGKPTKQQVVEAYLNSGEAVYQIEGNAEFAADILVKAGLIEEPREPGPYWVKLRGGTEWRIAYYWADTQEWTQGDYDDIEPPTIIGPRLLPPED